MGSEVKKQVNEALNESQLKFVNKVMEEKNKYYTPDIEEFHVGFECEIMNGSKWVDIKVDSGFFSSLFNDRDEENLFDEIFKKIRDVRVKYLDQEDIESLGWEYQKHHTYYKNLNYNTLARLEKLNNDISIGFYDGVNNNQIGELTFIIKNKSELKKLMKQLKI